MGKRPLWASALLLTAAMFLQACSGQTPAPSPGGSAEPNKAAAKRVTEVKPIAGYRAPNVIGRDVRTKEPLILAGLEGKVVVLNFWATWCGPCRTEMPELQHLQEQMQDRVKVVAVGVDPYEPAEKMASFANELNLTFSVIHDSGEAGRAYQVLGVPTTVFIDQKGIIRARYTGAMNLKQMTQYATEADQLGRK